VGPNTVKHMHAPRPLIICATIGIATGCSERLHERPKAASLLAAEAVTIARRAVATNDGQYPAWLQPNVFYCARPEGRGWSVLAERVVGTNGAGEPLIEIGGHRIIIVDENGAVTHYMRGR
jgi:hypothetical protein